MTNHARPDLLVGDRLTPITHEVGFLEADCRTVVAAWLAWLRPLLAARGIDVDIREVRGDLANLLLRLPPLTAGEITRNLFVPTRDSSTALFNNGIGGSDVVSAIVMLSGALRRRGLRVVAVPNTIRDGQRRGRYDAVALEIYGPEVNEFRSPSGAPGSRDIVLTQGKLVRRLVAMNDGGRWRFIDEGQREAFEDVVRYTARRVRDRFTLEMLRDYLGALGIRTLDADYYAPDGVATLVELIGAERNVVRTLTLEEARAHF